jgi:hypothetical protein
MKNDVTGACVSFTNFEGYFVWDVTSYGLVELYCPLRGLYCLCVQLL